MVSESTVRWSRAVLAGVIFGAVLGLCAPTSAGAQALPTVTIEIDRSEPAVNDPCAVGGSYLGFRLVVERDLADGPLTVELEITHGTPGVDFEPFSTTVDFTDGQGSVSIPIVPIQSGSGAIGVHVVPGPGHQVDDPGDVVYVFGLVTCVLPTTTTTTTAPPDTTTTTTGDTEVTDVDVLPRTGADPNLVLAGAGALTTGAGLWVYRAGRRRGRSQPRPF